jgi:transposase
MGRPRKINEQELILMLGQGLSHQKIADHMGCSRPAVTKAVNLLPPTLRAHQSIQEFKQRRATQFAEIQQMLLRYITPEKLKNASLAQIGTLFGIFYDKERLEKNLATEHVAHAHLKQLSDADRKAIKGMIQNMTRRQLEASQASHNIQEAEFEIK